LRPKSALNNLCVVAVLLCVSIAAYGQRYSQTNLVSDIQGEAAHTDPNLVNPWGVTFPATGPFWVADNGKGVATLYDGTGTALSLIVTIPPPKGSTETSAPTGTTFNNTMGFSITKNGMSAPATFLFVTEDGTISGWNRNIDPTNAVIAMDNSTREAIYKGVALAHTDDGDFLYATNFHEGTIEVYDSSFTLKRIITDDRLPERFAPFGIRNVNGKLYVTFARQDKDKEDDFAGPNQGFVDIIDPATGEIQRLISRRGLNSPWGIAIAPANFGKFSNDLLIGNFGDGTISAYTLSGKFLGRLLNSNGKVLSIDGLWTIIFGNGGMAGMPNELFFSAGPDDEQHGLFGKLKPVQ
jgi:uncharacterized protein (TIGR03118 family)